VHGVYRARTPEVRSRRESFIFELLNDVEVYPFTKETALLAEGSTASSKAEVLPSLSVIYWSEQRPCCWVTRYRQSPPLPIGSWVIRGGALTLGNASLTPLADQAASRENVHVASQLTIVRKFLDRFYGLVQDLRVALSSWTQSTKATTWSTGVPGRMPWPRLKMWPGRPPAWSTIPCTRCRI